MPVVFDEWVPAVPYASRIDGMKRLADPEW
jgi:hypothetical protein